MTSGEFNSSRTGRNLASWSAVSLSASSFPLLLKVRRQDAGDKPESRRWEEFRLTATPDMTLITALENIQAAPVTSAGARVFPVAWESNCHEGVCGSCTMLVDGKPRPACEVSLGEFRGRRRAVVSLEPLEKFALLRDLVVDRSRIFETFRRVHAWPTARFDTASVASADGPATPAPETERALEENVPHPTDVARELLSLGACTACGACLEACPEFGPRSEYVGAAALHQLRVWNALPGPRQEATERLETVMTAGGVADCGKAQNCVRMCPVGLPLTEPIQRVARATTRNLVLGWVLGST
jgi:succinate dehydrogenase / fumarate reductase, iron-sulfur subunit